MSAVDPVRARDDRSLTDFHGHETRRLANDHLWVDVLARAGPRIVRLGLADSRANLLAETPSDGWDTPHGRYDLFGGHRLWFAPEDPDRVAVPDGHGLRIDPGAEGIRLTGSPERASGLVRSMTLRLDPGIASLEVCHALRNVGDRPTELAPWSITQLPLGEPSSCRSERRRSDTTSTRTGRSCSGRTRRGRTPGSSRGMAC